MFDVYRNRATFTPAEAAALATTGEPPTDAMLAAIEGRAPCETPEQAAAREVRNTIRQGYERALWQFTQALNRATDTDGIQTAIEAAHTDALPYDYFSQCLRALDLSDFGKAMEGARFIEREAVATLTDGFHALHFHREALAAWLACAGLPSAYQFAPAAPDAEQLSPALQRQAARWQACIDAGLAIDANTFAPLPRGIGEVAKRLRITRQALSEDLRAYRERLASTQNGRQIGK